jgi:hypothetical protein
MMLSMLWKLVLKVEQRNTIYKCFACNGAGKDLMRN